jgi:hypothetical protein
MGPNGRPRFQICGDGKDWHLGGYGIAEKGEWVASAALSSQNNWRNLSVEFATEHSVYFRDQMAEIIQVFPELAEYEVQFDGPWLRLIDVINGQDARAPWEDIVFYHGTSERVAALIMKKGLQPQNISGSGPAYGADNSNAAPARKDAVYLTTQLTTAHWAAIHACRVQGSGCPCVLEVIGIPGNRIAPDVDARTEDARKSLEQLGSVCYVGTISPDHIKMHSRLINKEWVNG